MAVGRPRVQAGGGAHLKNGFAVFVIRLLVVARLVLGVLALVAHLPPRTLCGSPCPSGMGAVHPDSGRRSYDATVPVAARANVDRCGRSGRVRLRPRRVGRLQGA